MLRPARRSAAELHYDVESGELFVAGGEDDVDWDAIAICLKDVLLPDHGPAATMPLAMLLAAETTDAAGRALPDALYPKLSPERWNELRAASLAYQSTLAEEDEPDSAGEERHDQEGEGQADETDQGSAEHNARRRAGGQRSGAGGSRSGSRSRGSGSGGGGSSADRQLISYVDPNNSSEADDATAEETAEERNDRRIAGDAGVDLVIAHLQDELADRDLEIVKMPDMNKGYDVLVRQRDDHAAVRYIEVKSTDGRWGLRGVGLSRAQFDMAVVEGERYWLYVVEFLYEPDARVWAIRDPARQVGAFQFDHGWSGAADHDSWVQGAQRP